MKNIVPFPILKGIGAGIILLASSCQQENTKPNIIYILADDLGYGELGCYGQELIETPNIDELARYGMLFTQHYSGAPVCAPSRCVLLTGLHTGHAQVRSNDEWKARGEIWNYESASMNPELEGQRPMKTGTITIGSLLQEAGYKTALIGKWGLGAPLTESIPNKLGFDFFYGYNCQRQAHSYFPLHLWKDTSKVILNNKLVPPKTRLKEGADPYDIDSYSDYWLNEYAPELMQKELITFIRENDSNTTGHPFFIYYATPIPHAPLQAPEKWVKYYHEMIGEEEPYLGNMGYFPCRYPKATYAAMVSYLDEQVGEIIEVLKDRGLYENTIIIFSSDNGPTYNGGTNSPFFDSAKPFKSQQGWGKGHVHEGGIRIPMIASWPGKIQEESKSDHISAFYDVLPTLCEISGINNPVDSDGISFLPVLLGEDEQEEHEFLYWEFPSYSGQQAVRMGKWKAIRRNIMKGNLEIELYNLEEDIQELKNVADQFPEVVKQMEVIMQQEHQQAESNSFRMELLGDKVVK